MSERIDRIGVVASSLCATHCALSALLPAVFSALGLGLLLSHEAEWAFTLIAVMVALSSAFFSWRQARSKLVIVCLLLGVAGLLSSRLIEMSEAPHGHGHHSAEHHSAEHHSADRSEQHHDAPHAEPHGSPRASEEVLTSHAQPHREGQLAAHEEHDDSGHLLGLIVAILAGVFLLLGHISNIRILRQRHDVCCN